MRKIAAFYTMPHPPIIIPEVGQGEEKKIQKTYDACNKVADEIASIKPDTIIIVTPHGPVFSDSVAISATQSIKGDLSQFGAPQVTLELPINQSLVVDISNEAIKENIMMANITEISAKQYGFDYELDHGSLVPLYFINKKYSDYNIIHITYGVLPKVQLYKLGMIIKKVVEASNQNTVFIASGDLSHKLNDKGSYGYSPAGQKFDNKIISFLKKGDVPGIFRMDPTLVEEAEECGLRAYYIMLGAMNGYKIKGNLLSYEGTFGVGYNVMDFKLEKTKQDTYKQLIDQEEKIVNQRIKEESPYVRLARESLTYYLTHGNYMEIPSYITDEIKNTQNGVFVTLKKDGILRGCIGTFLPTRENVAKEIIENSIGAALRDPRFLPVELEELRELTFSVDILGEPVKATKSELDPKRYGIIVTSGNKRGLLLPDLEGVDTVSDQLSIALGKGNISPDEKYTIERFKVTRHY